MKKESCRGEKRSEAFMEDGMICPNCKRDVETEPTSGVLKYRDRYGKVIPVPRSGERCLECGHVFHTLKQEEIHMKERDRMIMKEPGGPE